MDVISNYKIGTTVYLIDNDGTKLGQKPIKEAVWLAKSQEMDLVQISAGNPPVAKIVDIGKYVYEQKKRVKEQAKKQRESSIEVKELHFRPNTEENDIFRFAKQATDFINEGDKVKVTVKLKGREQNTPQIAQTALDLFLTKVESYKIESKSSQRNSITIFITKNKES